MTLRVSRVSERVGRDEGSQGQGSDGVPHSGVIRQYPRVHTLIVMTSRPSLAIGLILGLAVPLFWISPAFRIDSVHVVSKYQAPAGREIQNGDSHSPTMHRGA